MILVEGCFEFKKVLLKQLKILVLEQKVCC